jgi:hypothetical protein
MKTIIKPLNPKAVASGALRGIQPTPNAGITHWRQSVLVNAFQGIFLGLFVLFPAAERLAASPAYVDAVLASHPAAYWRLNETAPAPAIMAADATGNGHTFTYAGNVSRTGAGTDVGPRPPAFPGFAATNNAPFCEGFPNFWPYLGSFYYAGLKNGYLGIPTGVLPGSNDYTVEMWINPGTVGDIGVYLYNRNAYLGSQSGDLFGITPSYNLYFADDVNSVTASTTTLVSGQWYDVAVTRQGDNVTVYINGQVEIPTTSIPVAAGTDWSAGTWALGGRIDAGGIPNAQRYNGNLDEIAIYGSALNQTVLQADYTAATNSGGNYDATILSNNPAAYWQLNETLVVTGTPVAADASGNGNTFNYDAAMSRTGAGWDVGPQPPAFRGFEATNAAPTLFGDSFYSTNDGYLGIPTGVLAGSNDYTIEMWIRPMAGSYTDFPYPQNPMFFYQRNDLDAPDAAGGDGLWINGGIPAYVFFYNGNNTTMGPTDIISPNQWSQLTVTRQGNNVTVYVNGQVYIPTFSCPLQSDTKWTEGTWVLGGNANGAVGWDARFGGNMDEVAIYGTALSPTTILEHYNSALQQISLVVSTSVNPSYYGYPVTFTATVVGYGSATPTGTVVFEDGAIILGSNTLTAGVATLTTTNLLEGPSQTITAVYSGDRNFAAFTNTLPGGQTVYASHPYTSYANVVLADNPLVFLPMNEATGPTAYDATTNGNNGTYEQTATPVNGALTTQTSPFYGNTAVTFNPTRATDDLEENLYLSLPTLGSNNNYTMEIWLNNPGEIPTLGYFLSGFGDLVGVDGTCGPCGTGNLYNAIFWNDGSGWHNLPNPLPFNTWYDIAIVRSNTTFSLYLDGILQARNTTPAPTIGTDVWIGNNGASGWDFPGGLCLFSAYNYPLSDAQVANHYYAAGGVAITVASSLNPSTPGSAVTFTATIAGTLGTPQGTVVFSDGATILGTETLSGGVATLTTASLPFGASQPITVAYSSDNNYNDSTGALPGGQTVAYPASTHANVVLADNPLAYLPMNEATGPVAYDATTNGNNGTYELTATPIAGALTTQTGPFLGNTAVTFAGSPAEENIDLPLPALSNNYTMEIWAIVPQDLSPLGYFMFAPNGDVVAFDGDCSCGPSGGPPNALFFWDGSGYGGELGALAYNTWYDIAMVRSNTTLSLYVNGQLYSGGTGTPGAVSSDAYIADRGNNGWAFPGGLCSFAAYNYPLTAAQLLKHYNAATATLTVTSSLNPSTYGSAVTFTATVAGSGATPTGTVVFSDGAAILGSNTLSGGVATLTTTNLPAGASQTITAVYGGDRNYPGLTQTLPGGQTVSYAPFEITSWSLDATETNLVVCWQSVPGVTYNVLTNTSLASPQNWGVVGSPILATSTNTCFTLPGGVSHTNVFVVIKQ